MIGADQGESSHKEPESPGAEGMLRVATSRFGEIEVDEKKLITLTTPFLGFPDSRRFVLRPHSPESPFMWLQSVEDQNLAFVVVQPEVVKPDYHPQLTAHDRQELRLAADQDLQILVILTVPSGRPKEITANLLGPLAINVRDRVAKQVLLDPGKYDVCWPVT